MISDFKRNTYSLCSIFWNNFGKLKRTVRSMKSFGISHLWRRVFSTETTRMYIPCFNGNTCAFTSVFFVFLMIFSYWQEGKCCRSINGGDRRMSASISKYQKILYMWRSMGKIVQTVLNLSKWLLLRSVFFTKNLKFDWLNSCVRTLLNNSH